MSHTVHTRLYAAARQIEAALELLPRGLDKRLLENDARQLRAIGWEHESAFLLAVPARARKWIRREERRLRELEQPERFPNNHAEALAS